jgi:hypothetical protein
MRRDLGHTINAMKFNFVPYKRIYVSAVCSIISWIIVQQRYYSRSSHWHAPMTGHQLVHYLSFQNIFMTSPNLSGFNL